MKGRKPTVLAILDGWGEAPPSPGNGVTLADTPNMDKFKEEYPWTTLKAYGRAVGLPKDMVSGSETGHQNIGAGRIIEQDITKISGAVNQGTFFKNTVLRGAMKGGGKLHIMGLLSGNGSPHSDIDHLLALLVLAKHTGVKEVYIHVFTDGRDSDITGAIEYIEKLQAMVKEVGIGKVATVSGRYYAMDRNKTWERSKKAYDALVWGKAEEAESAEEAVKKAYDAGLTDEFVLPTIIKENGKPVALIKSGDSVVFFNFRSDRARQFSKPFVQEEFKEFDRGEKLKDLYFVAMTDFGPDLPLQTAFLSSSLQETLPVALQDYRQLYIAETEKYAHITYFLNGGYADPIAKEERKAIDSPDVARYDEQPEMSAGQIKEEVIRRLEKGDLDFIAVNFANPDMVGHTGNLPAVIKACAFVDKCIGELAEVVLEKDGNLLITADHGNADKMIDSDSGEAFSQHSKSPVPFVLVSDKYKGVKLKKDGKLGNISPTVLDVMEVKKPKSQKEESLILK